MPNVQDRAFFVEQAAEKLEELIDAKARRAGFDHDRDVTALIAVLRDVLRALRAPV